MQRIQSSHPSVRPRMNTPASSGGGVGVPQRTIPSKPPPPIPTEDEEPQDTYEVPEMKESPEHYLSFEPTHSSQSQPEEPQVCSLIIYVSYYIPHLLHVYVPYCNANIVFLLVCILYSANNRCI